MASFSQKDSNTYHVYVMDATGLDREVLDGDTGEIAIFTKEEFERPSTKGRINLDSILSGFANFVEGTR